MKKTLTFIMIIITAAAIFSGCRNDNQPFEEKNYTSDETINSINLDLRDREVIISQSSDQKIHINYFENDKEFYDISVDDENVLNVTSGGNKKWNDYIGGKTSDNYRKITVFLPDKVLKSITVSTTNEDVNISPLTIIGDVNISSNGGNINFERLDADNSITLTVKNGNISGTIIGGYDDFEIRSEIKKGECNLPENKNGGEKALSVSGNNGNINIDFIKN